MKHRGSTFQITYSAILSALSLILVYVGALAPTGSWGIVALAGLFPAAAVISAGLGAGFLSWACVTVLAFLMVPDKFCVLLYGILFGLYPMLKSLIEGLRRIPLEIILKLLFFNVSFTVVYFTMKAAVLASLPSALSQAWALYLAGNVIFLLYDFGFSKVISAYITRIQSALGGRKGL